MVTFASLAGGVKKTATYAALVLGWGVGLWLLLFFTLDHFRVRENINIPFIDDPQAKGYWTYIDYVRNPGDFVPGKPRVPNIHHEPLILLDDGATGYPGRRWTKDYILYAYGPTAAKYEIKKLDGANYMFLEIKNVKNTVFHSKKYAYGVLKKSYSLQPVK